MRLVRVSLIAAAIAAIAAIPSPTEAIFGTPLIPDLGDGGGGTCAGCTIGISIVKQLMQINDLQGDAGLDLFCSYLPYSPVQDACKLLVALEGATIAGLLNSGSNPDQICKTLGTCTNPQCGLYLSEDGKKKQRAVHHDEESRKAAAKGQAANKAKLDELVQMAVRQFRDRQKANGGGNKRMMAPEEEQAICKLFPEVCQVEDHLPAFDLDNDTYSDVNTLRGADWRGKDCDDLSPSSFPGRQSSDVLLDENCNGIRGVDPTTGKSYEDLYCDGTGAMGIAALGDSATAHFHIPPIYMNVSEINADTYRHLLRNVANEMDWPMLSWSTGFANASAYSPDISGPLSSVYTALLDRNRCNHRDFMNLGVNGAKSTELLEWTKLINRNATNPDLPVKPLLTIFSMVGNDVCNREHDYRRMTKPAQYKANIIAAINNAASYLAHGSQIVLVPLVDGRILFDQMHNRIHPLGWLNQDITYTDIYDFLNCLDISPCWGWMNSNATVRNTTWEHASAMNDQIPLILEEVQGKFNNVNVSYLGNLFDDALQSIPEADRWTLIEPVDGFHPNQKANALIGGYLANELAAAGLLPPVNPNNAAILEKFGDQGGY